MARATTRQVTFADLELALQGVRPAPTLQAICDLLDQKLSASIPVHAVTVGSSGELSSSRSKTQELVYNVWFDALCAQQGLAFLYHPSLTCRLMSASTELMAR